MRLASHRIAAEAHYLLPGCAMDGPGVLALLSQHLQLAQLPATSWSIGGLSTGRLWGDTVRPSLIIRTRLFPEHWIIVTYADQGSGALGVSKYLVVQPTLLRDLRRTVAFFSPRADRTTVGSELSTILRADLAALDGLVDDLLQRVLRIILRDHAHSHAQTGEDLDFGVAEAR